MTFELYKRTNGDHDHHPHHHHHHNHHRHHHHHHQPKGAMTPGPQTKTPSTRGRRVAAKRETRYAPREDRDACRGGGRSGAPGAWKAPLELVHRAEALGPRGLQGAGPRAGGRVRWRRGSVRREAPRGSMDIWCVVCLRKNEWRAEVAAVSFLKPSPLFGGSKKGNGGKA